MEIKTASERLAALGNESRLSIFRLLVEAGPDGVFAGAIGECLGMPPATLSFHLAHLSRAGLVQARKDGRFIHYSADYAAMDTLIAFLTRNCCQGATCCLPQTQELETTAKRRKRKGDVSMPPKKTVLVLCTGNSCRSQMAEAILNHDLGDRIRALSAGTQPQSKVADGAIDAIRLIGLPTDSLFPKHVDTLLDQPIDLVVTVCDNAKETCPVFPRPVKRIHVPFHDPHGESLESFAKVRNDIRKCLVPAVREALGV